MNDNVSLIDFPLLGEIDVKMGTPRRKWRRVVSWRRATLKPWDLDNLNEHEFRDKYAGSMVGGGPKKNSKKNNPDWVAIAMACPMPRCNMKPVHYASSMLRHFNRKHRDIDQDLALRGIIPERLLNTFADKRPCPLKCSKSFKLKSSFEDHLVDLHDLPRSKAAALTSQARENSPVAGSSLNSPHAPGPAPSPLMFSLPPSAIIDEPVDIPFDTSPISSGEDDEEDNDNENEEILPQATMKRTKNKRHQLRTSMGQPSLCEICGEGFAKAYGVKRHLKNVHGKTDDEIRAMTIRQTQKECKFCKNSFGNLSKHLRHCNTKKNSENVPSTVQDEDLERDDDPRPPLFFNRGGEQILIKYRAAVSKTLKMSTAKKYVSSISTAIATWEAEING